MNATHRLSWRRIVGPALVLAALSAPSVSAAALDGSPFTLEVLVDGRPAREYAGRGRIYIEAIAGRPYSIRLGNHTPGRVAVALSVDGLNTIDAVRSTAREASKWILEPYQTITIDGWQTSSATARRFFFTTEKRSYGAWLGETANLGIISAAFFREQVLVAQPMWERRDAAGAPAREGAGSKAEARPESAPRMSASAAPPASDELAATGIGAEVGHQVRRVRFEAEEAPAVVLDLRYEFRDALVRLGVLPRRHRPCEDPLARRERAGGFERDGFAPDPYRADCP